MAHVGLDLSRARLDVHAMDDSGAPVWVGPAVPKPQFWNQTACWSVSPPCGGG
jgi:hypothetical protein